MPMDYLAGLDPYVGDVGRSSLMSRAMARSRAPKRGQGGYGSPSFQAAYDRSNRVAAFARPDIPGAPARDAAMLPAGFPVFSFALATGTNIITQQMNVQCPFRGQRLVATVIRNGASALVSAPLMQVFTVGMKPILASGTAVPLEIFNQNAFDTNLLLPPTVPGVLYTLGINLSTALAGTDTIVVICGVVGSGVL